MSSADVLPTAPPESVAGQQYTSLYPTLQKLILSGWQRLAKSRNISLMRLSTTGLYLKKYKKAQKTLNWVVAGLGVATTALSSGAVASALTGVGVVVGLPLGVVGGVCGADSTVLTGVNKKLEKKVNKHSRLSALAAVDRRPVSSVGRAPDYRAEVAGSTPAGPPLRVFK